MRQPRDSNGKFKEQKVVSHKGIVTFFLTEYECRIVGNRLERAASRFSDLHNSVKCDLHQECQEWSERFKGVANTRKESDTKYRANGKKRHTKDPEYVRIELTTFECWNIGLRLYEIGEWFEEKGYKPIAEETQWMARKFHAERKEVINNENE